MATFDWPIRAFTHDQKHFAFRTQALRYFAARLSRLFHFQYRGNTAHIGWGSAVVVLVVVLGLVLGFCLVFWGWWFWFASPINMQCFLSFYDDLGTPPTWRPHSWEKNQ